MTKREVLTALRKMERDTYDAKVELSEDDGTASYLEDACEPGERDILEGLLSRRGERLAKLTAINEGLADGVSAVLDYIAFTERV